MGRAARRASRLGRVLLAAMAAACSSAPSEPPPRPAASAERSAAPVVLPASSYRFAVIGDFGSDDADEASVAALVKAWEPAFVVTVGDNIYPDGSGDFDEAVGKYYAPFIGDYRGKHGPGSPSPRFWPAPGNHDWNRSGALDNYRAFFTLPDVPGGERYYDVAVDRAGLVHLYVVDSDSREPDGIDVDSKQATWLRGALAHHRAEACFHVVAFHHPPYTTKTGHGPTAALRWPFRAWGADLVLNGHNHHYERLEVDGFPYLVVGNSGAELYRRSGQRPAESAAFDDVHHGAVRIGVGAEGLSIEAFVVGRKEPSDRFALSKRCPGAG